MLVVNEEIVHYEGQPDRVAEDVAWPPPPGRYAIYLDVWRRLVTALDDPSIREVALGGPTTAARERTGRQARHVAVEATWTCTSGLPPASATTGRMAAQATPEAAAATPCLVPPLAGYTGLENQFYRVEVLTPGAATDLLAAGLMPVVSFPAGTVDQVELSVADAAALAVGDLVEMLATGPGSDPLDATFAQVEAIAGANVTLTARVPQFGPTDAPALRTAAASVVMSRENGSVVTTIERINGADVTVTDLDPTRCWVSRRGSGSSSPTTPSSSRRCPDSSGRSSRSTPTCASSRCVPPRPSSPPHSRKASTRSGTRSCAAGTPRAPSGSAPTEPAGCTWRTGSRCGSLAGDYRSGDYWEFPARAAVVDPVSGTIAWPNDAGPAEPHPRASPTTAAHSPSSTSARAR